MATQTVPAPVETMEIKLTDLQPNPFNRKDFNERELDDLARSIADAFDGKGGVIEPIIVRAIEGVIPWGIVAGGRRWLAAQIAHKKYGYRDTITSIRRDCTDEKALEMLLEENDQRVNFHPMQRADIYAELLRRKLPDGKPYTLKIVGERVHKAPQTVSAVCQLARLNEEIKTIFWRNKIEEGHASEICRLPPNHQTEALLWCFQGYKSIASILADEHAQSARSVKDLRIFIRNEIHLDLASAPFDVKDEFLVKGAGSCIACVKRTGNNALLWPDIKNGDTCTDRGCFEAKRDALIQIKAAEIARKAQPNIAVAQGGRHAIALSDPKPGEKPAIPIPAIEVQRISSEWIAVDEPKKGVLYRRNGYELAKPGCKQKKLAIWVDGKDEGKKAEICTGPGCTLHGGSPHSYGGQTRSPITHERKMEIWESKVQFVFRDALIKAVAAKLPKDLGPSEIKWIADQIEDTLSYHDQQKLARIAPEFEDIDGLKPPQLLRYAIIASLVRDLGAGEGMEGECAGGKLMKTDPLFEAAAVYKIDHVKLLKEAEAALEKKRPKTEKEKEEIEKMKQAADSKTCICESRAQADRVGTALNPYCKYPHGKAAKKSKPAPKKPAKKKGKKK